MPFANAKAPMEGVLQEGGDTCKVMLSLGETCCKLLLRLITPVRTAASGPSNWAMPRMSPANSSSRALGLAAESCSPKLRPQRASRRRNSAACSLACGMHPCLSLPTEWFNLPSSICGAILGSLYCVRVLHEDLLAIHSPPSRTIYTYHNSSAPRARGNGIVKAPATH